MRKFDPRIIDRFDDEPVRHWTHHWAITFGPILIFAIGIALRLLHWPYAAYIMALGLTLILIRSFLLFFLKKRPWIDWLHFLGRISLIATLAIHFAFVSVPRWILLSALVLFGVSVSMYFFQPKKASEEHMDEHEEDY